MSSAVMLANSILQYLNDGTVDLDTDNIQCALSTWSDVFAATSTAWGAAVAKVVGDIVVPTVGNGHVYYCLVAGDTGGSEPSWPKDGSTVVDNEVTWIDAGANILQSITIWIEGAAIWQATHDYSVDDLVRPTGANANGHWYKCTTDTGSSAGSEPTWPTGSGATVVDGGITWTEQGINFAANEVVGNNYTDKGVTLANAAMSYSGVTAKFDADDAAWANSTITARIATLWKDGTANGIVNPVILIVLLDDAPADVQSIASQFSVLWSADGILNWKPGYTFGLGA